MSSSNIVCENKSNVDKLNKLLTLCRCSYDPSYTHVSMGPVTGVYQIGSKKISQFWDLYLSVYETHQQYLAEKPGEELPILVDVDLKIKLTDQKDFTDSSLYTEDQVRKVVLAYQQAITDYVDFEDCDSSKCINAYTCVLLEKKPYLVVENGGTYCKKGGFHLHFPKLFLTKREHENFIIPRVKELTKGLFSNLGIEKFIDDAVLRVNWLLYGSSKISSKPYVATKCYLKDGVTTTLEKGLNDYKVAIFENENHKNLSCHNRVVSMLPRILSVFLYNRISDYYFNIKTTVPSPLLNDVTTFKKIKHHNKATVEEVLKETEILLDMISDTRAEEWDTWMKFGWCIYNISGGSYEGFVLWCNFSSRSNKFSESECISLWQNMRENNFTIGTLKHFAKLDNPTVYKKYTDEITSQLFTVAIEGGHHDLAKILHNEYNNEFVCTSIRGKDWYQFKNHIWHYNEVGTGLRERISDNTSVILSNLKMLRSLIFEKINSLQNNRYDQDEEDDEDEPEEDNKQKKTNLKKKLKLSEKLMASCKSAPFKHNIMVEAQELFYNERFLDLLNKNPYLIAFKNGVYDFEAEIFREGTPEDYLSSSLPIDYIDFKRPDHPKVLQVEEFFRKIFPDSSVRDYFLYQVSQVFIGGNRAKTILFWTGEGNNGKTVTQYLFEKMLGPMAIKFPTTLVTGKKSNMGVASPELARSGNGVRWAVMDEPNADETILSGTLKALTGNDSFFARELFQKGKDAIEITPMFKLNMICNKLPIIKDADTATWNRIRVVPFESTFLPANECPETFEEQMAQKKFPVDKNFSSDTIPQLVEALAWYLIYRRRIFKDTECVEPESVRVATDLYREDNDIFKQFEQQSTVVRENSKLSVNVLYTSFKDWMKEEYPHISVPSRDACRTAFVSMWGPLVKRSGWLNRAIATEYASDNE